MIALGCVLLLYAAYEQFGPRWSSSKARYRVLFSPDDGVETAVLNEIDGARESISVMAFVFSHRQLSQSLARAKRRGVRVRLVVDGEADRKLLEADGLAPLVDLEHPRMHNKFMIIDDRILLTGSANFTHQALERNAENVLLIYDEPELIEAYQQNFRSHHRHAQRR